MFGPVSVGQVMSPHGVLLAALYFRSGWGKRELLRVMAAVSRLGSKESFVDPLLVAVCDAEEVKIARTLLAAPRKLLRSVKGPHRLASMPWPITPKEYRCLYAASPEALEGCSAEVLVREVVIPDPPAGAWIEAGDNATIVKPAQDGCEKLVLATGEAAGRAEKALQLAALAAPKTPPGEPWEQ